MSDDVIRMGRGFPRPTVESQNPTDDQQAAFAYQVSRLTLASVGCLGRSLDVIIDWAHLAQDARGLDARETALLRMVVVLRDSLDIQAALEAESEGPPDLDA